MTTQFDPRITAYFGDAILQAGFVPLPHLFLRQYRELGLSHVQAMFILQLMEIAWDLGDPPNTVSKLAARMRVTERSIRLYGEEVRALGLIEIYDQFDEASGAQVENGYDLAPLFHRLSALVTPQIPAGQRRVRRARDEKAPNEDCDRDAGQAANDAMMMPARDLQIEVSEASFLPPGKIFPPPTEESFPPRRQNDSPAEGIILPPAAETDFRAGRQEDSGLKKRSSKNLWKKTRRADQQQTAADFSVGQPGSQPPTLDEGVSGRSLRWGVDLSSAEVAQSRTVLALMRLNAPIVDTAAPALHPAECWALWCYARARGLAEGWIANQVVERGSLRPRLTAHGRPFDDVGRLLAMLPLDHAGTVLDIADRHCFDSLDQSLADPDWRKFGSDEASRHARAAFDALWPVMAFERQPAASRQRVASDVLAITAQHSPGPGPMPSDAVSAAKQAAWQIAQDRVKAQVEATSWCTWLEPLRVLEIEDAMVVLAAPNVFVRNEVSEHYACIVTEALEEVLGRGVHVEFVIEALQAV